jgi:translation initiation factor 4G
MKQETTFPVGTNSSVIPEKALQEKELALLGKYQRMLQTLLPTIESQVTAVHSLQVFCLSHNFPKGMLLRWFIALYNLSIVDEEAFMRWKEDVNDAYPGKGDALFQVINY